MKKRTILILILATLSVGTLAKVLTNKAKLKYKALMKYAICNKDGKYIKELYEKIDILREKEVSLNNITEDEVTSKTGLNLTKDEFLDAILCNDGLTEDMKVGIMRYRLLCLLDCIVED